MRLTRWPLVLALLAWVANGQPAGLVANSGFEAVKAVTPGPDGLVAGWRLAAPEVPEGWSLNTAYPGQLALPAEGAHDGQRFARLQSRPGGSAHLYQMLAGLEAGAWYRLSVWTRGGPLTVSTYDYYPDRIGGQTILHTAAATAWTQSIGFLRVGGEGWARSALALAVGGEGAVDVDDVSLERLDLPPVPAGAQAVTFESQVARLTFSPSGQLASLADRGSGAEYAAGAPVPVVSATRGGTSLPLYSLQRDGDRLIAQFLDPAVRVILRVTPRERHFVLEVVEVQPADVDAVAVELPVKRLATNAGAFNATYDDQFGIALFGITDNVFNQGTDRGPGVRGLRSGAVARHGLVGAKWALVAAPAAQFQAAVIEAEQANGLPSPFLRGKWARVSEPARRSYLFGTGVTEGDIDTLIEYAKVGGFGTIIFLKNDWLANHGHYDINTRNFPSGLDGVKRAVEKIHAAGLDAGVHVFGPSVSPDDPYVTPKPDDRLAFAPCPPLAAAVDDKATELAVAGAWPVASWSKAYPGKHLRLGDEIVQYAEVVPGEAGAPTRLIGCRRGTLGTAAAAHPAGAEVQHLLAMWGFFLVDPDSTLATELTGNFARVFNAANFDFVYFDASDGIFGPYVDRWYYLNRLHRLHYEQIGRPVLYQTSNGTGTDVTWHIVPRSASADGHGDIKGYLDDRWAGILGMGANWTKADIGWYYWFKDVRPDQIEYVCAKALGVDGSISLETSRAALESQTQSRQVMEMIGRWERCRAAGVFGEAVQAKLREPQRDFKLFELGGRWQLQRAAYEDPRPVDALDGRQNAWTIEQDGPQPCQLGVEIVRGRRLLATADYHAAGAVTIEPFDDAAAWLPGGTNDFEKFVQGDAKVMTDAGPVRRGVTQRVTVTTEQPQVGDRALVYAAENAGDYGGWGGIGRRFAEPVDLSRYAGLGLWIRGDNQQETLLVQLRDAEGRWLHWPVPINFSGWRLFTFPLATERGFDLSKVSYLLYYFNAIEAGRKVAVTLDDLRAVPALNPPAPLGRLTLTVNGTPVALPGELEQGQALTVDGPAGITLWPGGMAPGQALGEAPAALTLRPGRNEVTLSTGSPATFGGDLTVLLYRLWPMEE